MTDMSFPETHAVDGSLDISVVIGFKDWGVTRLKLAVESLKMSFGSLRGEVIVSDYGSTHCPEVREVVESLGARHVYTVTDGVWSRSRALNAGFAASVGRILVSTDADMIFSPRAMEIIGLRIAADPSEALVLQCRNLPEGVGSEWIEEKGLQWETFAERASLRPRWGMGGMMATSREAFLDVRGYDERMQIYGGEDIDFAQRVRRSGRRLSWVEDPEVRMYHMWHPSSRTQADATAEGKAAIEYNREILLKDRSFVRNVVAWRHRPADAPPAVSVVISTRNRGSLLGESIQSALAQTASDLEVLVVDDGSEDDTREVVEAITDDRVRYLRSPGRGLACARNFAAEHSRARFTVVHDDDDLMMPDRVERHLHALQAGDSGTYGGWVDFHDRTGSVVAVNRGKPYSLANLLFAPGVYAHATVMLETRLIREVGYDERFTSGSDYNLAIRLARLGVSLRHTGHVHLVRRLHAGQVTRVDSSTQRSAGRWSTAAVLGLIPVERQNSMRAVARNVKPVDIGCDDAAASELIAPYLPDALVERDLTVVLPGSAPVHLVEQLASVVEIEDLLHPARETVTAGVLPAASWEQFAAVSRLGRARVTAFRRPPKAVSSSAEGIDAASLVRLEAQHRLANLAPTPAALVTGRASEVEAQAGPMLLGHWRAGAEDHYLLALPQGSDLLAALEKSGQHRVERMAAREVSFARDLVEPASTAAGDRPATRAPTKKVAKSAAPGAAAKNLGSDKRLGRSATAGPEPSTGPGPRRRKAAAERPVASEQEPPGSAGAGADKVSVARQLRAASRFRPVLVALVVLAAVSSAGLGGAVAGVVGAIAAAVAGATLAACSLLGLVFARRAWHVADRLDQDLRAAHRRLAGVVRAEGGSTRRVVTTTGRRSAGAVQSVVNEARTSLAEAGASLSEATETLLAAHSVSEAAHVAAAERTVELRGEVRGLGQVLDDLRSASDATADRLQSEISRATVELLSQRDRRMSQLQVRQLQSLLGLYSLVRPRAGTPGLGGWAASPDVMLMLADELLAQRPTTVVECGSGASTVWLSLVAREFGLSTKIVALEHDEEFARATRRDLERHGLGDVAEVRTAPLRDVEGLSEHDTPWYDAAAVQDLQEIGLVFVDGPPGPTGPRARFPVVPVLRDRLAPECVLVLDDAERDDERAVVDQWRELLPDFDVEVFDVEKGAVVLRRGSAV